MRTSGPTPSGDLGGCGCGSPERSACSGQIFCVFKEAEVRASVRIESWAALYG